MCIVYASVSDYCLCFVHRFYHQIWSDGIEGINSRHLPQNIAHKEKSMLTILVTELYFTLPVSSVATGQILHVVRVCITDVPVTHTSPIVVQISLQLLSNRTTVCCLHHRHIPHDQGGRGYD